MFIYTQNELAVFEIYTLYKRFFLNLSIFWHFEMQQKKLRDYGKP